MELLFSLSQIETVPLSNFLPYYVSVVSEDIKNHIYEFNIRKRLGFFMGLLGRTSKSK